jgi:hypothetical protein
VDPNITAVAPVNPVPVTVTEVPPPKGPRAGEILVTVGAAAETGPTMTSRRTMAIKNIIQNESVRLMLFTVP